MTDLQILEALATLRQALMGRVASYMLLTLDALLVSISKEIEKKIMGEAELTELGRADLNGMVRDLQALIQLPAPDLFGVANVAAMGVVSDFARVNISASLPTTERLQSIARTSLSMGDTIGGWYDSLNYQVKTDIGRVIRAGVSMGKTNREISKDIIATKGVLTGAETLQKAKRNAMAITRTAVMTVANKAVEASYKANIDFIKAYLFVATLDNRTSVQCMALDGTVWSVDGDLIRGAKGVQSKKPELPLHWNCRSVYAPVTRLSDLAPSTRSSMGGQISSLINFEAFMQKEGDEFGIKMLGKKRYNLYKDNKISLSELLNPRTLEPLSMAELNKIYPQK